MEDLNKSCRTCLRELDEKCYSLDYIEQFEDITLTTKLLACVPEMKLEIGSASLCFSCTATLRLAYEFRKTCLATEAQVINEYQCQTSDNKISIFEQPIIKTEAEVKVEEIYLDEDEDDWLRANGYFNTNSDDKDSDVDDIFEETDTAESDPYECVPYSPNLSHKLTDETNDQESIIKKSCENIEFLKERKITPENLQCCVVIEKLPESYSYDAIEDTTSASVENDEPTEIYSCDRCGNKFSDFPSYKNHMYFYCFHKCGVCGKTFHNKYTFRNHMKLHEKIKCRYCDRGFPTERGRMKHIEYHQNRTCVDCNLHFRTRLQLYYHTLKHKSQPIHVTASTPLESDEPFRRIVVSEDEFEKAVKSFSSEILDEQPPIIEKYCCSGNCNCANKNSNFSDSSDELPDITSLTKISNDFIFVADSVRKSKEIAKKNIKNMAHVKRKYKLKQGIYRNRVVSEHNYCKTPRKKIRKGKRFKKLKMIPGNSNVAEESCRQTKTSVLQQFENLGTNLDDVIGDTINEKIVSNECNIGNPKKCNVGDDMSVVKKQLHLSKTKMINSNEINQKAYLQKSSTKDLGINNMSLADLLKDTVNVNSKIRQSQNSETVTLKDLLNDMDDPPTSVHVVNSIEGTVTNYIFPNAEHLNVLTDDTSAYPQKLDKKSAPATLKEVPSNIDTDNLCTQSQMNPTDSTGLLNILTSDICVYPQNLPDKKSVPAKLKEVPTSNTDTNNLCAQSQMNPADSTGQLNILTSDIGVYPQNLPDKKSVPAKLKEVPTSNTDTNNLCAQSQMNPADSTGQLNILTSDIGVYPQNLPDKKSVPAKLKEVPTSNTDTNNLCAQSQMNPADSTGQLNILTSDIGVYPQNLPDKKSVPAKLKEVPTSNTDTNNLCAQSQMNPADSTGQLNILTSDIGVYPQNLPYKKSVPAKLKEVPTCNIDTNNICTQSQMNFTDSTGQLNILTSDICVYPQNLPDKKSVAAKLKEVPTSNIDTNNICTQSQMNPTDSTGQLNILTSDIGAYTQNLPYKKYVPAKLKEVPTCNIDTNNICTQSQVNPTDSTGQLNILTSDICVYPQNPPDKKSVPAKLKEVPTCNIDTNNICPQSQMNPTDSTGQLNILTSDICVYPQNPPDKKSVRAKLKEVPTCNIDTNNICTQSQMNPTDSTGQLNILTSDICVYPQNLPDEKSVPTKLKKVPINIDTDKRLLTQSQLSTNEVNNTPSVPNLVTIGSEKNKILDTINANLSNSTEQTASRNKSKIKITVSSGNKHIVSNVLTPGSWLVGPFLMNIPKNTTNNIVNAYEPVRNSDHLTDSQICSTESPICNELDTISCSNGNHTSVTFPSIQLITSCNSINSENRFSQGNTHGGPDNETSLRMNVVKPAMHSSANSIPVITNSALKNRQKESISFPSTSKNTDNINKPTNVFLESYIKESPPTLTSLRFTPYTKSKNNTKNQENDSLTLPTTLKFSGNNKIRQYTNKRIDNDPPILNEESSHRKNNTVFRTTLKQPDNMDQPTVCGVNSLVLTNSLPENQLTESIPLHTPLESAENKRSKKYTRKSIVCTSNDPAMLSVGPSQEKDSTSFPTTPMNKPLANNSSELILRDDQENNSLTLPTTLKFSGNKKIRQYTNKSIVKAMTDQAIPNDGHAHKGESTYVPVILKQTASKECCGSLNQPTLSSISDLLLTRTLPENQSRKSIPPLTFMGSANNKNNNNTINIKKSAVVINNDREISNEEPSRQKESTLFTATPKETVNIECCGNIHQPTVNDINNENINCLASPINLQTETTLKTRIDNIISLLEPFPTTPKETVDIECCGNINQPTGNDINNENNNNLASPINLQTETTLKTRIDNIISLLESDSEEAVNESNNNNSKNVFFNKTVAAETDTFSINFNYIRNQIEGNSENVSPNEIHNVKVKSFAKEKHCVPATVTTQSTASERSNEQETAVTDISSEKFPEIIENIASNVECGSIIFADGNSESKQNQNELDEIPFDKNLALEKIVDDPIDVISLAKRNYDREIKKLFNLTFKPLSLTEKTQECDDIHNKEVKSDESNKDEPSNELHSNLSSIAVYEENAHASKYNVYVFSKRKFDTPISGNFSRKTSRKKRKVINKTTTKTAASNNEIASQINLQTETKLSNAIKTHFDLLTKVETSGDDCSSKLPNITIEKENKSSNQDVDVHAINENASTSKQQLIDERLVEQECSTDLTESKTKTAASNNKTASPIILQTETKLSDVIKMRFDLLTKVETSGDDCSSKLPNITIEKENKSSNQNVDVHAINENASTSKQQLIDGRLVEQESSTDLTESITSNQSLSNIDFELFHEELNLVEQKEVQQLPTNVNLTRRKKLKNRNVNKKCSLKKLETERVVVVANKTDNTESRQVIKEKSPPEKKDNFFCRVCRKYFDSKFERELHECQFTFVRSARKTAKEATCEMCGNVFTNEILKNLHSCSRPSKRSKGSLKCTYTICNQMFTSYRLLNLHLKNAHEVPAEPLTTEHAHSKSKKQCFLCKKFFKNGLYRFLHLLGHFSFRKYKCKGPPQKPRQSGKTNRYRLSELVDVLQIQNVNLKKISKRIQKETFSKILNKMLNYLHLVRCRKCNRVSGGWFNEPVQNYRLKRRYVNKKAAKTNRRKLYSIKALIVSPRSYQNKGRRDERNKSIINCRKQTNPLKRMTGKQILIRKQMLKVMEDLGLSAKEVNTYSSDALEAGSSKSADENDDSPSDIVNSRLFQLLTNNIKKETEHSSCKKHTCKYCLLTFSNKVALKMHKSTPLHKQNVALLQKSENEIEQELLKSINEPQTLEDVKRAIEHTTSKIQMIKKYHCEFCSDSYISRNQLEMHKKVHEEEANK